MSAATVPQETLDEIVRRIVERTHPLQVILFGSHARGDAHAYSDIDLLVVVPDAHRRRRAWDKASTALRGLGMPKDIIVVTPEEIARQGDLVGSVLRPAMREGRILYDARPEAQNGGQPPPLEVRPVTEPERLAETEHWLDQAEDDLRIAQLVLGDPEVGPHGSCYHAQQAAEKALKAVLVFLQVQYPFTPNLDTIRKQIPAGWRVKGEFRGLKRLSDWAFKARYPGPWRAPTPSDAQHATSQARAIYESVLRDLRDHGFAPGKR